MFPAFKFDDPNFGKFDHSEAMTHDDHFFQSLENRKRLSERNRMEFVVFEIHTG